MYFCYRISLANYIFRMMIGQVYQNKKIKRSKCDRSSRTVCVILYDISTSMDLGMAISLYDAMITCGDAYRTWRVGHNEAK